jgi:hypothetical protein
MRLYWRDGMDKRIDVLDVLDGLSPNMESADIM